MRFWLTLGIVLLAFCRPFAQVVVPGFYVTDNKDTVHTQVRLPSYFLSSKIRLSAVLEKVETIDSIGQSKIIKPGQVKCLGFRYDEKDYTLYSPPCSRPSRVFLQPLVTGLKSNLYVYKTIDSNGNFLGAVYTLENASGDCTSMNTAVRKMTFFRTRTATFYNGDTALQQLIDRKFIDRRNLEQDLVEVVKAANQ